MLAFVLAMAVIPATYSADPDKSAQDNAVQRPVGPATVTEPLEPPIDSTAKAAAGAKAREDYQAKLKRCEGLASPVERKECTDRANKGRGQM
jgi:hypothetical protein